MTDCGPLDDDTREVLFSVPDREDSGETVTVFEGAEPIDPSNDPLSDVGTVKADEEEVVQDILQRMNGGERR